MHTKGPWNSVCPPSSCLTTRFIEGENGEHVAGSFDYPRYDATSPRVEITIMGGD